MTRLHFIPIHLFRETPQVSFFDASVPHSNGTEFMPVSLRERADLQAARAVEPWRWSWQNGHIRGEH